MIKSPIEEVFDNHKLSTWRSCPLKGYYRHKKGFVIPSSHPVPALVYGDHVHKALDLMYQTKDVVQVIDFWMSTYSKATDDFDMADTTADKHSAEVGLNMLTRYWNYWQESIKMMDLLACEQYFVLDLELDSVKTCSNCSDDHLKCIYCKGTRLVRGPFYCGRIDKVFIDKRTGQCVGMDHKTTSFLSGATINAFKISQQFRGYVYFLMHHSEWKDIAAEYFYFDLILKTKTRYNADGQPFYRDTVLTQPEFLEEWLADTKAHVQEIRAMATKINEHDGSLVLPRQNSDACNSFGRLCTFYDLCSHPKSMRETLAEDIYEIDFWHPLEVP